MPVINSFIDKIFRDKKGRLVVSQYPNAPILGWFVFWLLSKLINSAHTAAICSVIAAGFLLIWALLELVYGVNYFRRLLGAVVLGFIISGLFN